MTLKHILSFLFILLLFSNCNTPDVETVYENNSKDSSVYSSPEQPGVLFSRLIDTNITKHLQLVEMKFKVKTVDDVCENIEDILVVQNGYLSKKYLKSRISKITKKSISSDSCLLTTYYSTSNTILLRVPNQQLESTLQDIRKKIEFLDYKYILSDDRAIEKMYEKKSLSQNRDFNQKIELTKSIEDNPKTELYSAIIMTFYENPSFKTEIIAKEKSMAVYDPSFNTQLYQSFYYSIDVIKFCAVYIVKYWTIILLVLLCGGLYYLNNKTNKLVK